MAETLGLNSSLCPAPLKLGIIVVPKGGFGMALKRHAAWEGLKTVKPLDVLDGVGLDFVAKASIGVW